MINVTQAVSNAKEYLSQLYSDYRPKEMVSQFSDEIVYEVTHRVLEEVELSEDEKYWLVTFSLLRKQAQMAPVEMIKGTAYERVYKTVKVDAKTGEPVALKIRNL